ncbi:MAG: hypothetical protein ACO2ZM_06835 [Francisellaceae bacterium]
MRKKWEDQEVIKITFFKGEPIALNDQAANPVTIIQMVQNIASPFGIGRDIHVGDTVINIKGRVGFEAAAPMILIKAHHHLEKHTLTKMQQKLKEPLANQYGELVHDGHFLEPALREIEAYLMHSQNRVSGDVFVELNPWHFHVIGCQSPYDLLIAEGSQYGENNNGFSAEDVKGFTKILSNQLKTYQKLADKHEKNKDWYHWQ